MKKLTLQGIMLFLSFLPFFLHAQLVAKGLKGSNNIFFGFYEYKPANYTTTVKYPLIIFLHGISERGNGTTELYKTKVHGIPKNIAAGHKMTFTWNGKTETFLVLVPQCLKTDTLWKPFYIDEMLKYAKANLSVDTNRIILTGLSMGGGGTWAYTASSSANAAKFSAISPVAAACMMNNGKNIALGKPSVWAFHSLHDTVKVALASCTQNALIEINKNNPPVPALGTFYNLVSHACWGRAYDTTYKYQNPNIYEWFLNQKKNLAPNKFPVANAGKDTLIHSATGKAYLRGTLSYDPDGTILKYNWRKISGPTAGKITYATSATATVTSLTTAGTYKYELQVIDNRANWKFDTVVVTVNASPIANAGPDASITLPTNIYRLNGSSSSDPDGTIVYYKWTRVSGPNTPTFVSSTSAITDVKYLIQGTYRFRLTVKDNKGGSRYDDMYLTVNAATSIITSVDAIEQNTEVRIFADNSSKTLFIHGLSHLQGAAQLKLIDINGRQVKKQILQSNRVSLNGLIKGIYLVDISNGKDRWTARVFVE
jgi:hypothetical protein